MAGRNVVVMDETLCKLIKEFVEFLWQLIAIINHMLFVVHVFLDSTIPTRHQWNSNGPAQVVHNNSIKGKPPVGSILERSVVADSTEGGLLESP